MDERKHELMTAVRYGTPELVRALVLTGADIDEYGPEAVLEAINAERPEILDMLVSLGADIANNTDGADINILESYVLRKIKHMSDLRELSPQALSIISILIKNGLSIRENGGFESEFINRDLRNMINPRAIEIKKKIIEQIKSIERQYSILKREDGPSDDDDFQVDFNI